MLRYTTLLLFALALAPRPVLAQAVFRSVMPDGKIIYGDKPAPGAKESKQVNLPPPNISSPAQPSAGAASPRDAPAPEGNNNADVENARRNLEAAKKALEEGREPRDGERTGVARKPGGAANSQLNESYYQRVKSLEDAVTAAQNELDAAQRNSR